MSSYRKPKRHQADNNDTSRLSVSQYLDILILRPPDIAYRDYPYPNIYINDPRGMMTGAYLQCDPLVYYNPAKLLGLPERYLELIRVFLAKRCSKSRKGLFHATQVSII